jgi:hypothetical protein
LAPSRCGYYIDRYEYGMLINSRCRIKKGNINNFGLLSSHEMRRYLGKMGAKIFPQCETNLDS